MGEHTTIYDLPYNILEKILFPLTYPSLINFCKINKYFNEFCKKNKEINDRITEFVFFKRNHKKRNIIVESVERGDIFPLRAISRFKKLTISEANQLLLIILENANTIKDPYVTIDFLLDGSNLKQVEPSLLDQNSILDTCIKRKDLDKFFSYFQLFSEIKIFLLPHLKDLSEEEYLSLLSILVEDKEFYSKIFDPESLITLCYSVTLCYSGKEYTRALEYLLNKGFKLGSIHIINIVSGGKVKMCKLLLDKNYTTKEDILKLIMLSTSIYNKASYVKFIHETLGIKVGYSEYLDFLINNKDGLTIKYLIKHKLINYTKLKKNHYIIR